MATSQPLFLFDWQASPPGVRSPELAATWASLEVQVDDDPISVIRDVGTGVIQKTITVPLYSLAEWISFNWWLLLLNGRVDSGHRGVERRGMHPHRSWSNSLRGAGDGFLWPDLTIAAVGDLTRLEWHRDGFDQRDREIRYVSSGTKLVDTAWIASSLAEMVEAVLVRLSEAGIKKTPLHDEWDSLRTLDVDEQEFCAACGRLGIDPFSEGQDLAEAIANAFENVDPGIRNEFLDAADPYLLDKGVAWTREALSAARAVPAPRGTVPVAELRSGLHAIAHGNGNTRPYVVGYEQARRVRSALNLSADSPFPDEVPVGVEEYDSPDPALQGLTVATTDRSAAGLIIGWKASDTGRRFARTRAFWHLLFGRLDAPFLLSEGGSRDQQMARAFAAELLCPAEGIRTLLPGRGGLLARLPVIADRFGVSELVVEHQIENQLT